jgi:hypothetical protein
VLNKLALASPTRAAAVRAAAAAAAAALQPPARVLDGGAALEAVGWGALAPAPRDAGRDGRACGACAEGFERVVQLVSLRGHDQTFGTLCRQAAPPRLDARARRLCAPRPRVRSATWRPPY